MDNLYKEDSIESLSPREHVRQTAHKNTIHQATERHRTQ